MRRVLSLASYIMQAKWNESLFPTCGWISITRIRFFATERLKIHLTPFDTLMRARFRLLRSKVCYLIMNPSFPKVFPSEFDESPVMFTTMPQGRQTLDSTRRETILSLVEILLQQNSNNIQGMLLGTSLTVLVVTRVRRSTTNVF